MEVKTILGKQELSKTDLVALLDCRDTTEAELFRHSRQLRDATIGNGVHMRGLIEISNVCIKDCLYCGIRKSNSQAQRYELNDEEIVEAAIFAYRNHYGSVVLQGGERHDPAFILRIERLVREIKHLSNQRLGITLSLGEQTEDTYRRWFDAGAHRYLLRIETSNESLYRTGTGVMIGLPFQTTGDLADDLLFLKSMDIDMVGMGPYLEHRDTPLWRYREALPSQQERLRLGLHMVSCLRLLMPDINIAATTALQAIDPEGREKALEIGANVIMPNITPLGNRGNYRLYENKPGMDEGAEESTRRLMESVKRSGCEIQLDTWGDSLHFQNRVKK